MSGLLTALNQQGKKQIAPNLSPDSARSRTWNCPICNEQLNFVSQSYTGRTAHFRHQSAASHPGVSESERHASAKQFFYRSLREDNACANADLEHIVEKDPDNLRVADILLDTYNHGKIVVEIQCSLQSVEEFERRTDFYNKRGYAVLWILDEETYFPKKSTKKVSGTAFKDAVKWVQRHYFGRSYTFSLKESPNQGPCIRYRPIRLQPAIRAVDNQWASYKKKYRTIGEKSYGSIPCGSLTVTYSKGRKIARFFDKCWWAGGPQ
ncbi:competence protein CoiA family protein [Halomontanus rarus]|uniref:competence protein CoiA n=1 Tax=Halomontanus rarus TaxID=3034020 RepID=UPI001A986D74